METRNVNKTNPLATPTIAPSEAGALQKAKQAKKISNAGASGPAADGSSPGAGVNVELSPQARQMAEARKKALDIARATPDIREDRVASLKAQIDAGTYVPDSGKIADGMMREAILDRLSDVKER